MGNRGGGGLGKEEEGLIFVSKFKITINGQFFFFPRVTQSHQLDALDPPPGKRSCSRRLASAILACTPTTTPTSPPLTCVRRDTLSPRVAPRNTSSPRNTETASTKVSGREEGRGREKEEEEEEDVMVVVKVEQQ